nr:hypothetical protein [Tanacetum cinerariifolium]
MATTIEQQVALDEALVPSTKRLRIGRSNFRLPSDIQSKESTLQVVYDVLRQSPFFKAFLVMADVPEIYMQEFWATAMVHQHSIRFKMDTRKHIVDLEAFREMLHISHRIPGQSFAELTFKEEILEFLRNTKAYKEYYACATREAAPKPKASARKKRGGSTSSTTPPTPIATPTLTTTVVAAPRLSAAAKGKQPARATSPTDPSDVERTKAEQLKIVLRRSRHEMHIFQQGGSGTNEGTDVDEQTKGRDESEGEKTDKSDDDDDQEEAKKVNDDDDDEDEVPKIDEQDTTESGEGADEEIKSDGESEDEETTEKEEESFDPIPRTPEESEDDGNGEEDQGLRISEEERIQEEDKADELYRDSSSTSSFVTNLLKPIIDPGMESIFTTGSSTVTPIPSPQSTMTPSIMTTTTTASQLPIHPTPIPSLDLQNLLTFVSVFRFEDRVKSLEVNFSNIPATGSACRSTTGSQSRQLSASESAFAKEPVQSTCQMEEPSHSVFETAAQGNAQSWISALAKQTDARSSFNELQDTPIDLSNFIINLLGVDTLTPELLAGPTYELMRGSCNSLTELEYHLEEVYKATTDQLDWVNPEGASSRKYTTSVTKTKAADYRHIKWIKDLVPRTMWIQEPINYDKHALWGVSHWGRKRQQFYGFAVNWESALDVYSKRRIIAVDGKWRYLIPAKPPIHNHMLIPKYQDFKREVEIPDGFECFQAIKIGSTHFEPTPSTPNTVKIIPGPIGTVQQATPSGYFPNPVRIIPGHVGIVQQAKLLKEKVFILDSDGALMSTQEYMQKVVEDDDFNSGAWVSATNYMIANGGSVTGCLGYIENFLKKGKLDQVIAIVKSCSLNVLGDLTVTMKDLSGTIHGIVHHKVIGECGYGEDITVGAALILANVLVFSLKPSTHYLNITMRNVVKVIRKDTTPGSSSG